MGDSTAPSKAVEAATTTTVAAKAVTAVAKVTTSKDIVEACIAANKSSGPKVWDMFSGIAYLIITLLVVAVSAVYIYYSNALQDVGKNWAKYRCNPSIMPFASFYGHNTADNFNYCMGNIFQGSAMDIAGPFTGILTTFSDVVGGVMSSTNSLRQTVATLGGGINVIFQDFTDRIQNFFFQLRLSSIRIKNLLGRMYGILFSVMYMNLSGMTAASNFGNTTLFKFLDTFCFEPETRICVIDKGYVPIYTIKIGDVLEGGHRVTAKFHFKGTGQAMVRLGSICVSTNHFVRHEGSWIRAEAHPDAVPQGPYERSSLFCLNTDTHCIPIDSYMFRDYDEMEEGDEPTMRYIESRLSVAKQHSSDYSNLSSGGVLHPETLLRMKDGSLCAIRNVQLGDSLSTGACIAGIIHKKVHSLCSLGNKWIASGTLIWQKDTQSWVRIGTQNAIQQRTAIGIALVVLTNSQIELENGLRIRDYMELCSPDAEHIYEKMLSAV